MRRSGRSGRFVDIRLDTRRTIRVSGLQLISGAIGLLLSGIALVFAFATGTPWFGALFALPIVDIVFRYFRPSIIITQREVSVVNLRKRTLSRDNVVAVSRRHSPGSSGNVAVLHVDDGSSHAAWAVRRDMWVWTISKEQFEGRIRELADALDVPLRETSK